MYMIPYYVVPGWIYSSLLVNHVRFCCSVEYLILPRQGHDTNVRMERSYGRIFLFFFIFFAFLLEYVRAAYDVKLR